MCCQFYVCLFPLYGAPPDAATFFSGFIGVPIFLVMWAGYSIYHRTGFIPLVNFLWFLFYPCDLVANIFYRKKSTSRPEEEHSTPRRKGCWRNTSPGRGKRRPLVTSIFRLLVSLGFLGWGLGEGRGLGLDLSRRVSSFMWLLLCIFFSGIRRLEGMGETLM